MNPVILKVYAICCVVLFIKMASIGFFQGGLKAKNKSFTNPEDAKFFAKTGAVKEELPALTRAGNAYRNDLENIPIFLFLALTYGMLDCWEMGALIYFSVFTFARVLHTVTYLRSIQPWRTISFAIGAFCCIAISGHILYKVLM